MNFPFMKGIRSAFSLSSRQAIMVVFAVLVVAGAGYFAA